MYILDTDHLSFLERSGHPVCDRLSNRMDMAGSRCVATIVSYEEQCRGWLSTIARTTSVTEQIVGYRKLLAQLRNYCRIEVMEFDERAAVAFQSLKKQKVRIPTMDLKIASIALANDAILLTRNARDFIKIPGLRFEDWTKE